MSTSPSPSPVSWGILATGRIAGAFARGVAASRLSRLAAVGSRSADAAGKFAAEHGIPRAHASYEALLADPEVEAVYIATPHPLHLEWIVRAAAAGKHVLCEKPLGLNRAEAMVAAEECRRHDVLLMEAFMYRCHPQTARVVELILAGAVGRVGLIEASFGFHSAYSPTSRLWANELAGGGILDVGGYPVSFARLVAGATERLPFLDPVAVTGAGHLHPETGIDVYAAATLKFSNGVVAQVATGVGLQQRNTASIYGSDGVLHVMEPWIPSRAGGTTKLVLQKRGAAAEEIAVATEEHLYGLEADAFAAALRAGRRDVPQMSVADTLGNLDVLDQWRAAIGLTYASERPEALVGTHTRRPLRRREDAPMRHLAIPGVRRAVARLVMGCDNQRTMPHAAAMWDDYFERGGNAFDTAYVYGGGLQERLLGQWMRNRGNRDDVVVIAKGAHTPLCTPEHLSAQLRESLERLQTDRADVYLMHRDNPAVPVGEFVDVLNEQARAGRVGIFGGSNWTLERVAEANAWARGKGLQGFGAVSNNFSLARMVDAVWAGCIAASDPASRRWLRERQTPLFAWSSQARGFFTERAGRDRREDAELVRCWYSEDNFERRARAVALAERRGVSPIAIAAAYVLHQPFPTFALVGPRTIAETVSSCESLDVRLTEAELAWLNLEALNVEREAPNVEVPNHGAEGSSV
jgi:aryl-alcohol dehydrogenase-like predicted oxidoreductase